MPGNSLEGGLKTVRLVKLDALGRRQTYIFRYLPGDRDMMRNEVARICADRNSGLDVYDELVISSAITDEKLLSKKS